jgi:hypothetical protein
MAAPPTEIRTILATDCGSTTTKAILIEKQGDVYRQTIRGEAPTTVEAPFDDVTVGVLNASPESRTPRMLGRPPLRWPRPSPLNRLNHPKRSSRSPGR